MKRAIAIAVMVLALVGFIGLTGSMAATSRAWKALCAVPGYTNYIGAPGSCSGMNAGRTNTPSVMGTAGF